MENETIEQKSQLQGNESTSQKVDGLNSYNEVSALIEGVLLQTQERFQTMSNQILRRIDDMAKRVDDLEKNISSLMTESGINVPQRNAQD